MIRKGEFISNDEMDKLIQSIDELYQIHYPEHKTKKELLHKHLDRLERDYEIVYINEYPKGMVYSIGLARRD